MPGDLHNHSTCSDGSVPIHRLPLLADGSEVIWVCGAGFADGLAPQGADGLALHLEILARKGEQRGR